MLCRYGGVLSVAAGGVYEGEEGRGREGNRGVRLKDRQGQVRTGQCEGCSMKGNGVHTQRLLGQAEGLGAT